MAKKKLKKYLPQSTAGLVRYYDEDTSKIRIDPRVVIGFSALLVVMWIILRVMYAP